MIFSLWTDYGATNSKPVFDSFASGVRATGGSVVYNEFDGDVGVIWSILWNGRMANNKTIWEHYRSQNKPVIVLEVGGIERGTTWKVGINGINREAEFGAKDNGPERANLLNLKLEPWRSNGRDIIICGQHDKSHQWRDMPTIPMWVLATVETIRNHTARPIIFRPHPRCRLPIPELKEFKNVTYELPQQIPNTYDDFNFDFHNAWAVVNWSSNPATQAVIGGIPVFVGPDSLAWDVGNESLTKINEPTTPNRQQWLNDLAYTEWTTDEISQGLPLNRLTSCL
jgi:hypothetical protein